MTTFLAVAENSRLEFKEFNCNAVGVLDQVEGKYLMTEVVLNPTLVIIKEEDKEKALRVLDKSEKDKSKKDATLMRQKEEESLLLI